MPRGRNRNNIARLAEEALKTRAVDNQLAYPVPGAGMACEPDKGISLKDHKRLTNLAYEVKNLIDKKGGLNYQESYTFGQIMQTIIHLK